MNLLDRINQAIGFTKNELRIVLFLIVAFMIGGGIKIYKSYSDSDQPFNYTGSDKLFQHLSQTNAVAAVDSSNQIYISKDGKSKPELSPHSININAKDKSELMKLPGIGETTAKRIIEFREKNGPFKKESDLLKVKGIGKKKLEQIKQYIKFQ
jgi:competence protein ComEA